MPIYAKDWWAWATKPSETAKNKLNPTLHAIADAWLNKDFFGTEIRHKDDPWIMQLSDTAEYLVGRFRPFSVQNFQRMRQEGSGQWRAGLLSAAGIRRAPQYITLTPARQLALEYIVARLPQGARTKEDFERAKSRKDIKQKYRAGNLSIADATKQAEGAGLTPTETSRLMRDLAHTKWQETFQRLSFEEAVKVYQIATDEERHEVKSVLREKYNKARPGTRGYKEAKAIYEQFLSLEPENAAEIKKAHMELLEARAEAFAEGREWDTKEGRSKHDAIRAHARELGIDSEKTWKRALGDVRRQYTDLFNDAIDRKADASRYVRARTGLGYSIKNEQMPLARNHALGLIEKGVPRNVAQAWLDRARAAFDAAKG